MKYETAELEGDALDYMVRCAESGKAPLMSVAEWTCSNIYGYNPSRNWDQAGPIIQGERINLRMDGRGFFAAVYEPFAIVRWQQGPTPLVAAMRAFVTAKCGPEIELPD